MNNEETFYTAFTERARAFVPSSVQAALKSSLIAVAGLGSVGGPIATALLDAGAMRLILIDPDRVAVSNLSRQPYYEDQVGENKAEALKKNLLRTNPYAQIKSIPEGINNDNASGLVSSADMVVDAIDLQAIDMVYRLHEEAHRYKKPTFVGYDLGHTAVIRYYPYGHGIPMPLNGEITEADIKLFSGIREACMDGRMPKETLISLLYSFIPKMIDLKYVPTGQLREALNREKTDTTIYQASQTPRALSALLTTAILRLLDGEELRSTMSIDLDVAVHGETAERRKEQEDLAAHVGQLLEKTYDYFKNNPIP